MVEQQPGPIRDETCSGLPLDPWLVRHLLLSIDDRPRSARDGDSLEAAIGRTMTALSSVVPPAPFVPPAGSVAPPGLVGGVPGWVFETNAWVLAPAGPGGDCIVVDVPPVVTSLLQYLAGYRLRVSSVFLTHGHLDHAGGVGELLAALPYHVPVFVHPADVAQVVAPVGSDGLLARAAGIRPPDEGVFVPLVDGERIVVAGVDVLAVHTPGHTVGAQCYLVERTARPLLFTGDQLFASGMGRSDLYGGSFTGMVMSMATLLARLDDDVVLLPGHGEATTVGIAKLVNPYLMAEAEAPSA